MCVSDDAEKEKPLAVTSGLLTNFDWSLTCNNLYQLL